MNTSFDKVREMREHNYKNTEPPSFGGSVDYFYVGAYGGGDDVLCGILDNLLSDMEYPNHTNNHTNKHAVQTGGFERCREGCTTRGGCHVCGGCDTCGTIGSFDVDGGCDTCGGCATCGRGSLMRGGCDTCGGGKHHKNMGKKNLENEDGLATLTQGPCAYGDCPVYIKDDEDESLVVVSEPPVYTDVGETEYELDTSEDNSLVVVKKGFPLIIETPSTLKMRNEDLDKPIPRSVSDAFFDDTNDDVPLVVTPSKIFSVNPSEKLFKKEGRGEIQNDKDNIKMEDYKVVANYIKKYVKTINKKVF
jgi:hypothetical protein